MNPALAAIALTLLPFAEASPQDQRPPEASRLVQQTARDMSVAAAAWLGTLPDELRARAALPFGSPARTAWGYHAAPEVGVALGELDGSQRAALDRLLRTGLSDVGYLRVHGMLAVEELAGRDPGLYRAVVFGDPSGDDAWAWKVEGHHLSLNFTARNERFVTATPLFVGIDPVELAGGTQAGFAPFQDVEARIRELMLSAPIQGAFDYALAPPEDVFLHPQGPARFEKAEGLPIGKLVPSLRTDVMGLWTALLSTMNPQLRAGLVKRYQFQRISDVRFHWVGSPEPGKAFYLRISSTTDDKDFALEYVSRGDHAHFLLRDHAEDFGAGPIEAWK